MAAGRTERRDPTRARAASKQSCDEEVGECRELFGPEPLADEDG